MIKFVTCIWNGEKYIKNCIRSLLIQTDQNFEVYIIDDLSTDNTVSIIQSLVGDDPRFHLIVNTEKKFRLRNMDEVISNFDNDDIVIELDGDDYLSTTDVVSDIREVYRDGKVWVTNGSSQYLDGSLGPSRKCNTDTIREDGFFFSHLRTFRSFLWKKIPKSYFLDDDGKYFKSAADVAYGLCLLEMAGNERYMFLPKIYYIYNDLSPFNDHKPKNATGNGHLEQMVCGEKLRKKPKMEKLPENYDYTNHNL